MQKLTPTTEQEASILQTLSNSATLCASDLGTGKTLSAIESILRSWSMRSLIIAPLGTRDGWEATMLAQSDGEEVIKPCAKSPKAFKENLEDFLMGKPGHYFMGREFFVSLDWTTVEQNGKKKRKQKHLYRDMNLDFAVYDEVHNSASATSNGSKTWTDLNAKIKLAQSATWYGNKFENAYTIAKSLWPDSVPKSFPIWVETWCNTEYDHFSYYKKKVVGEKNPGAFVHSLPSYVQLRADNKHPVPEIRWVDLSASQRKTYDQLQKNMVVKIEENYLITSLPIEMRTRLRQLTLGEVTLVETTRKNKQTGEIEPYLDVQFDEDCKSSKIDELFEIVKDYPDEPIMIASASARFAKVVNYRLNKHFKKEVSGLYAGTEYTSHKERQLVKDRFAAGELKYFVGVIEACKEGLDHLQDNCRTLVQLEMSENQTSNEQLVGRLNRRGQTRAVRHFIVNGRETYDDGVLSSLMKRAIENNASRAKHGNS